MSKVVYFVRHGQTKDNVQNTLSHPDEPLSEQGLAQAQQVADRLKDLDVRTILTSPYRRAHQTAEAINTVLKKDLVVDPVLGEQRNMSQFRGQHFQAPEVQAAYTLINANVADEDWHYGDEENFFDLRNRSQAILDLLIQHPDPTVLVVTHGNILRTVIRLMLLGDLFTPEAYMRTFGSLHLDNTGVSVCQYDEEKWKLVRWNDTVHLEPNQQEI